MTTNGNFFLQSSFGIIWVCAFCVLKLWYFVRFKEKYENPILKGNDKHASEREKCIGSAVAKVTVYYLLSH